MKDKITKGYLVLAVAYIFLLLVSNIMAGKLSLFAGMVFPSAVIIFPLVYVISDLMTEVYGIELSMFLIRVNTICSALMAVLLLILVALPYPDFWKHQEAYATVFFTTPRIILASLCGYYFGDWLNSTILSVLKAKANKLGFAFRSIVSTTVGQVVDTSLFIVIAFTGVVPSEILLQMVIVQYLFKVSYGILCVPFTSKIVKLWKKWDGTDVTDKVNPASYNPFSFKL